MSNCEKCSGTCDHRNYHQDKDYLIKLYIEVEEDKDEDYFKNLNSSLIGFPGVEEVSKGGNSLEIIYDDRIISPEEIRRFFNK